MGELLYYESHWPLAIIDLLKALQGGRSSDPNTPELPTVAAKREWFSQARVSVDSTVEVITTRFKIPLSVSEISFEALRVPTHYEIWYQDRSNNWRPVLDRMRLPVALDLAPSSVSSWYTFQVSVYPLVAKALQFRINRNPDPQYASQPYYVGLRNTLIKRNVYDRSQGTQYLEDEQDTYGNVISKTIRDWDPTKAVDGDTVSYWKSAPQPDPYAVVSLYLDCRNNDNTPKLIDKLYIDPVYSGQHLNLYYTLDDTVGVRKPSPITVIPTEDVNTSWRITKGRLDEASGVTNSYYRFNGAFGPLNSQDTWLGVEWTPSFDPLDGPSQNPILFQSQVVGTGDPWHPTLTYDVGAGEFQIEFTDGTTTRTYSAPLSTSFVAGTALQIVAGWRYNPDTVFILVKNKNGQTIASLDSAVGNLPDMVSLDGVVEFSNFRGLLTATVLKLEDYRVSSAQFHSNPVPYVSPDPVIPDINGVIPSTTLDNSIYVAAWTEQEHGTGGVHETAFQDKEWTPIWRDYVAERGMLYFPRAISMKYLKLEFTNLTEEPYPVYESGIDVKYKVFPISVMQQSSQGPRTYTAAGGFLGLGSFISQNGVRSINWLNPASILEATNTIYGRTVDPVQITAGQGYVTGTLPNMIDSPISDRYRIELGSEAIVRRTQLQPYILIENEIESIIKAEGLSKIAPYTTIPWQEIEASNTGAISKKGSPGALPIRGTDWWIFPGQTLRIPASVMEKLTDSSTVVERKTTLEHRIRFTTTAVHRYDIKTVRRDAAIAYFAGVREVFPLASTYIVGEDKEQYDFVLLDPTQWVYNNVKQLESGPLTTESLFYTIENPLFLKSIANWSQAQGTWTHNPSYAHWGRGSIEVTADGTNKNAYSTAFDVEPGDEIGFSVWTRWDGLEIDDDEAAIQLIGATYLNETPVDHPVIDEIESDDWAANADSVDFDPNIDGWVKLEGVYTVPSGVNRMRVQLSVTSESQAGTVGFDWVSIWPDYDTSSTVFKSFQTTSKFNKMKVDFRDSGLVRSNAMWADDDPSDGLGDQLAYYTETIPAPSDLLSGMWSDSIKTWSGNNVEWGTPFAVVSITVDGERNYQKKRCLHFRRGGGAGSAGIKVRQWTNVFGGALARIGSVSLKPFSNANIATVRLRRLSDGVFVYENQFTIPTGRWYENQTPFFTIPADPGPDDEGVPFDPHMYELTLTLTGDAEDELYVNDLYLEIAHIRYFARLGGIDEPLVEVTDLRYKDTAYVTCTSPVNEASVQATILSPKSYLFGATITPTYLS